MYNKDSFTPNFASFVDAYYSTKVNILSLTRVLDRQEVAKIAHETHYTMSTIDIFLAGINMGVDLNDLNLLSKYFVGYGILKDMVIVMAKYPYLLNEEKIEFINEILDGKSYSRIQELRINEIINSFLAGLSMDEIRLFIKKKADMCFIYRDLILRIKSDMGFDEIDIHYLRKLFEHYNDYNENQLEILRFAIEKQIPKNLFKKIANPKYDCEVIIAFVNGYLHKPNIENKRLINQIIDNYNAEELNEMEWEFNIREKEGLYENSCPEMFE